MAIVTVDYFSKALMRTVTIHAIVPVDKVENEKYISQNKYKTLYLLHGILGNDTDWIVQTRIKHWAQEQEIVVIMPSGENKFYVDNPKSHEYFSRFIGEELVEITRQMFPLSSKREDTCIGGLSMGGYGAIINGLKYHQTFGSIIGMSSALLLDDIIHSKDGDDIPYLYKRSYLESVFGDLNQLIGSDKDYQELIRNLCLEKQLIPRIYLTCGTEDFLIKENRAYRDLLKHYHVDYLYEEFQGDHDWEFWNQAMKNAMTWWLQKRV